MIGGDFACRTHCLQGLLNHTVIKEADELQGMYKQAFDRIINQVSALRQTLVEQQQRMHQHLVLVLSKLAALGC